MHENYLNILHDLRFTQTRFTEGQAGTSALYALLLLVLTGIIRTPSRCLQARTIAKEANINGAGIVQVVEERLHELEQTIETSECRKSPSFKMYCSEALRSNTSLPRCYQCLAPNDLDDFSERSPGIRATSTPGTFSPTPEACDIHYSRMAICSYTTGMSGICYYFVSQPY